MISKEEILSKFLKDHPESASLVLMKSDAKEIARFLNDMPEAPLSETLSLLPVEVLEESLSLLSDLALIRIISKLDVNLVRTIFYQWRLKGRMDDSKIEVISQTLDSTFSASIQKLLSYSVDTLGSIMNPTPFAIRENLTAKEVLDLLKKEKGRYNKYLYVVDDKSSLHGVVSFKDLYYAKKDMLVATLMSRDVFYFLPSENIKSSYRDPNWRQWDSVPIVNNKKKLIGLVKFKALEKEVLKKENPKSLKDAETNEAATAISEVFQIGIAATVSTLMIPMNGSKKNAK